MSKSEIPLGESEPVLDHGARCLFELSPAVMMIVSVTNGRVLELNAAGHRLLGAAQSADDLEVVQSDTENGDLALKLLAENRKLDLRCSPLPGREDVFVAALADEMRPGLAQDNPADHVLPSIGAVTDRILHDVRNLIFPLVCHMDLAMASVDTNTDAFSSLLEVQASCRRCENELEKLSALSASRPQPERFVHAEDILERASLLLRYVLPKRVAIEVEVGPDTKLIRVSPTEFQRLLVDIASLAHARKEQLEEVQFQAENDDADVLMTLQLRAPRKASQESYGREQDRIRELLASRVSKNDVTLDVQVEPEQLRFEIRILERATASTRQLENRNTQEGRGEIVLILHHQPMMRDLLRNYLGTKNYQSRAHSKLDELLEALNEEVDAVVADISNDEARQLIERLDARPADKRPVLVLCRGSIDEQARVTQKRLEHPFRMDEVATALRELLDS